jgi:hypothetical protein
MHYSIYRYSMQVLQGAVQQLMLVPLEDMEEFLVGAIAVSGAETDLEKRKLKAAEDQLDLIRLAQSFSVGVKTLLESTQRRFDLS